MSVSDIVKSNLVKVEILVSNLNPIKISDKFTLILKGSYSNADIDKTPAFAIGLNIIKNGRNNSNIFLNLKEKGYFRKDIEYNDIKEAKGNSRVFTSKFESIFDNIEIEDDAMENVWYKLCENIMFIMLVVFVYENWEEIKGFDDEELKNDKEANVSDKDYKFYGIYLKNEFPDHSHIFLVKNKKT